MTLGLLPTVAGVNPHVTSLLTGSEVCGGCGSVLDVGLSAPFIYPLGFLEGLCLPPPLELENRAARAIFSLVSFL